MSVHVSLLLLSIAALYSAIYISETPVVTMANTPDHVSRSQNKMSLEDPCSFANFDSVRIVHGNYDLNTDFDKKVITGQVDYLLKGTELHSRLPFTCCCCCCGSGYCPNWEIQFNFCKEPFGFWRILELPWTHPPSFG